MPVIESSEQLTNEGFYIFNGTATNDNGDTVNNIIVQALDGVLHVARYQTGRVVVFNEDTENFTTLYFTTSGLRSSLSAQAPNLTWSGSAYITVIPTEETTLGKIIPTEEVSGINYLNVIEDEPSDI